MEERGFPVSFLKVDGKGRIDMDQLKEFLAKGAGLVSVMLANNEIGTVQDIKTIAKISHGAGALVHTDAVQAVGKIPVDVKDLDVDFLTLSAHKIYGPKGVGALYVRKGIPFCPFIRGGHQERGRRAGTENTLGIVALGKAVELRKIEMADEFLRLRDLRTFFSQGIEKNIPNVKMNGDEKNCLPNTLNVSFAGAEGEAILLYLDLEGIAVSTGSACASGSLDPSHVLLALGLPAEEAHGAIRFSMGRETTEEDINYVLTKLPKVIEKIRNMSSAYMRK
jgi:cysteine desulfurase